MGSQYENAEALLKSLKNEKGVTDVSYEMECFTVDIHEKVGEATVEHDDDDFTRFNWNLSLGPINSGKLLDFLSSLEAEPDPEEDDGETLYEAAAKESDELED